MAATTLYLVRHCEAAGNIGRVFQGHIDAEISENGARQLDRLAERFRAIPLDIVYTSPLIRARRTAEAVNRWHGLPLITDDALKEINGGAWEGVPWAQLPERYPQESEHWIKSPWAFQPPDGEAMADVYDRMAQVLTRLAADHPGKTIAAVSHGCAIRNALCWAKGWPITELNAIAWCDNTAVSVLEFTDGQPRVVLENDNSHLDDTTSTFQKQRWWRGETANPFE